MAFKQLVENQFDLDVGVQLLHGFGKGFDNRKGADRQFFVVQLRATAQQRKAFFQGEQGLVVGGFGFGYEVVYGQIFFQVLVIDQ